MTAPKRRVKGQHLHIDRGKGAKEIHKLKKTKIAKPPATAKIEIDEKTSRGRYTNAAAVAHSKTEFILDFMFLLAGSPRAEVHTRLISSPRHTKRLLAALTDNIAKHEKRFKKHP